MNIKVIRDFLPEPAFEEIRQIILSPNFKWSFTSSVTGDEPEKKNNKLFLLHHLVYERQAYDATDPMDKQIVQMLIAEGMYYSMFKNYYDVIGKPLPKGQFLKISKKENLLRIKVNFYPNTTILKEHDYHIDYQEPNTAALLALNTCDGYTKIRKTGEKYPSVANTLLLFDSSKDHCSTTTTNALGRFNININFLNG